MSRGLSAIASALVIVCLLLCSLAPRGAAASDDPRARAARHHFEEGRKWYKLGRYPAALEEFEAAYLAKDDPIILFNIAQCYRMMGDHQKALRSYQGYLKDRPKAENRAVVAGLIKEEEAALRTPAQTAPESAAAPEPAPEVAPAPAVMPAPAPERASGRRALLPAGIALGVAGVLAVAAGGALWSFDGKGACDLMPPVTMCPQNYSTATPGTALVAGGAALVVAGAVAIGLGLRARSASVAIAPALLPNGAGAALAGTF